MTVFLLVAGAAFLLGSFVGRAKERALAVEFAAERYLMQQAYQQLVDERAPAGTLVELNLN